MQDQILQALRQNDTAQAVQLAQAWVHDEPGQASCTACAEIGRAHV